MRPLLLSVTGLLLSASPAAAQATLVHAPEYRPGREVRAEVETEIKQTLNIAGMNVETEASNFAVALEKVESVSADEVVLTGRFEVFQINLDLPGGIRFQFDKISANREVEAGPLGEMAKLFRLMSATSWQSKLGPDGKMKSMEWLDIAPAEVPEMFRDELSSERFIKAQQTDVDRLPGKQVQIGESWTRNEESPLGNGQFFSMSRRFTYQGKVERNGRMLDHVAFKTESIQYHIAGNSSIPLQAKESNLKIESSDGNLWYDPQHKQTVEVDDKLHVTGDLVFLAGGNELPATLDLTMRVHTTVK